MLANRLRLRSVIFKLLTFTAAMIGGPIGTYFLTLNTIYKGWHPSSKWHDLC